MTGVQFEQCMAGEEIQSSKETSLFDSFSREQENND
jgi:hypothetical protein